MSVREPCWTSGRECWAFRAKTPSELCGYHPQLIGSALAPGESLGYLLYTPIFDAQEGPFMVGGAPGSHAVGLTPNRLLISRDPHSDGHSRSVTTIDLAAVSSLEIGCALALGWFVVRYKEDQGARSCPVLFGSPGMEHFRAIVRFYRQFGGDMRVGDAHRLDWPSVWRGVPPYIRAEAEPLIEATEAPLAVLRTPERWTFDRSWRRRRTMCTCAEGLLVATSRGLLWVATEPRPKPEGSSFGVTVTVVRPERLRQVAIGSRESMGLVCLEAGDSEAPHAIEVPFDRGDAASAEKIVRLAGAWGARA